MMNLTNSAKNHF